MIGPALPPTLKKEENVVNEENILINDKLEEFPDQNSKELLKNKPCCIIGPSFPEDFFEEKRENKLKYEENKHENQCLIGPKLNIEQIKSKDEIGPNFSDFSNLYFEDQKQKRIEEFEKVKQKLENQPSQESMINKEKKRDDWMIVPPSLSDLNSRSTFNLKTRMFNTGKSTQLNDFSVQDINFWTESYEERQKRMIQEEMGIRMPSHGCNNLKEKNDLELNSEKEKKNTGRKCLSLYEMHLRTNRESIDDPSKRMFDREKDVLGENCMNFAKRQKIMNFSKDMSRFSSGTYL
ncbi:hypothetical protein PCANB_001491 [Pneumocystis canis]|nr:hypothetical protein PCK1_001521 [Pneumocystis canis]KAG5439192.1 hypothetical protein PCANB_001491 [Pneumocystis canis]